ncbi:hypothetical protein FRACYDRAFT_241326 [Fragilariopsis cylindrus CCMP1102]|uniref:PDZ domain-containing protein n=1 Tax=Fragilariopsis cylindrus CCMP1102 TaxID=635003 RepID=A0A1E7F9B2_9STRA|nr:hypothetical protein FRACYDRAFT_241326 [Fragilariopsis cylindrus CCMP1102]|eukprot:OEU14771.1 hypothetical protein FRACYDRAFT_241326 [Fragilariopsis cylindrus CCMP1102]
MGFLKKIFRGGRKKNKNSDNNGEALSVNTGVQNKKRGKGGIAGAVAVSSTTTSGSDVNGGRNNNYINNNSINNNQTTNQQNNQINNDFRSPRSSSGPIDTDDDGVIVVPNTPTYSGSNSEAENTAAFYNEVRNQTQEQLRIAYENSRKAAAAAAAAAAYQNVHSGDDKSANNDDGISPRLTSNQLQQWDHHHHHHQQQTTPTNGGVLSSSSPSSQPSYSMPSDLPVQQIVAMDDMDRSDGGSSFNLSTDAEDSEYESMKRTSGSMYYPTNGLSALDTSAIDTVTSVTSYTTDEDRKIFPNLPTDDEMTLGTEASSKKESQPPSLLLPLHRSQPDHEPGSIEISYPMSNIDTTGGNLVGASWTDFNPSSKNNSNNGTTNNDKLQQPTSTKSNGSSSTSRDRRFFPASTTSPLNNNNNSQTQGSNNNAVSSTSKTSTTISRNKPGVALRDFTSPKSLASSNTEFSTNSTGNIDDGFRTSSGFDFSNFPSIDDDGNQIWTTMKEEKKDQPVWEDASKFHKEKESSNFTRNSNANSNNAWIVPAEPTASAAINNSSGGGDKMIDTSPRDGERFDDPFANASSTVGSSHISGSSSAFQQDTSLSELLEAAKSKRKDRRHIRHSSRASSSSVNSAPAITASFLRQHHNLGNRGSDDNGRFSTGTYNNNGERTDPRDKASADGTSVSDIIESLEATDRMKKVSQSHQSMGDTGVVATARAAKERLRERRRRERDGSYGGRVRNSLSRESDSDESEGHEASESWLFDQVTGAIGPVGIAADLESLSGRSNRSKTSAGNKSHKSSRRRSRKSSSRRHRSDQSVDSHGSRTSRNSRYSHRSTKSFLSQMSEQSRSVANDLLRLEMQLAMVGSKDKEGVQPRAGSSSASLGGASRGTTRSSSRKASSRGTSSSVTSSSSIVRRSKTTIVAPPGKLGIILANKADSKGTVVSGVRTSSVLVDRISPGDRIVAIDGEDVSRMTVSEITTIMSRKAEYERRLTVLTIPKSGISSNSEGGGGLRSPTSGRASPRGEFENSFSSSYRR